MNQYNLNPKLRAVILTEGEEWRALDLLFRAIGVPPDAVGIELRSIAGNGNFSVANWQCFVEYMHEKQTLVYFVVDREGQAEKEARRLLERTRKFQHPDLKKVVPSEDRIRIWDRSFEESNFSDAEIVTALALQGVNVDISAVLSARGQTKGLISSLASACEVVIDKPRLCRDLAAALVEWRGANAKEAERPVEEFIRQSASLIVLNHQPASPEARVRNLKSGLLG